MGYSVHNSCAVNFSSGRGMGLIVTLTSRGPGLVSCHRLARSVRFAPSRSSSRFIADRGRGHYWLPCVIC